MGRQVSLLLGFRALRLYYRVLDFRAQVFSEV